MAEILEFDKKCQDLKSSRDTILRQRKIEALRKIFQCTRCMLKCAKCGTQLETEMQESSKYATPYTFCRNCYDEYQEYRERAKNDQWNPRYYWHNDTWVKVWESWIEHQRWLDRYRQSKEFLELLQEVEDLFKK
jgi:hypothetical protein